MNIQQIMKQAQQMQEQMQRKMAEMRIEASAGGGMVTVVVDGLKHVQSLKLDPEVVNKDDVEMLQDLIVAAVNEAVEKSRKLAEESDRMYLEQIRQLNAELGRQSADLELANSELEAFNYSVSHDLRGPLTRITGYCQLMLEDSSGVDPQTRTYLARIYESSCWLDKMIDTMLKLAQLTRADFSPEPVNLSAICQECLGDLLQADPGRVVEVKVEQGVMVLGDESLLKILMTNLINNAWKYSSRTGQARIEFGVQTEGPAPVYFVRDNGTGFDMKDADKLFRVFTRLHDPTQYSGSGIGLATVHRIISRHGGRIWAEGEVGRGATFFFTLAPEHRRHHPTWGPT